MPKFKHDCERCEHLATITIPYRDREEEFDLYHCPGSLGGTLVARFGDDGPEYASFDAGEHLEKADYRVPSSLALRVAQDLAIAGTLIRKRVSYESLWEPLGTHGD